MKQYFQGFREPVSGFLHLPGFYFLLLHLFYWRRTRQCMENRGISSLLLSLEQVWFYFMEQVQCTTCFHFLRAALLFYAALTTLWFCIDCWTYTPVCLIPLRGIWGWSFFSITWSMAITGMFQAFFWLHAPRWFSTSLYLIMGWLIIFAFFPLIQSIPVNGIVWIGSWRIVLYWRCFHLCAEAA